MRLCWGSQGFCQFLQNIRKISWLHLAFRLEFSAIANWGEKGLPRLWILSSQSSRLALWKSKPCISFVCSKLAQEEKHVHFFMVGEQGFPCVVGRSPRTLHRAKQPEIVQGSCDYNNHFFFKTSIPCLFLKHFEYTQQFFFDYTQQFFQRPTPNQRVRDAFHVFQNALALFWEVEFSLVGTILGTAFGIVWMIAGIKVYPPNPQPWKINPCKDAVAVGCDFDSHYIVWNPTDGPTLSQVLITCERWTFMRRQVRTPWWSFSQCRQFKGVPFSLSNNGNLS